MFRLQGAARSGVLLGAGSGITLLLTVLATEAFAQAAAQPAKIDAGDTAWMISATGLVLMMSIPGLALFYAGMVRKKNVLATMAQTLAAVALGSILWVVIGYSLAFVGESPGDWNARPPDAARHGHEHHQPAGEDDPGNRFSCSTR